MSKQSKVPKHGKVAEKGSGQYDASSNMSSKKLEVQSTTADPSSTSAIFEPFAETGKLLKAKRRILEKRYAKLQRYRHEMKVGNALVEDQAICVYKLEESKMHLDDMRELEETYWSDMRKLKEAMIERKEIDRIKHIERLVAIMRYKEIIAWLQNPKIYQLFHSEVNASAELSTRDLALLQSLHAKINPTMSSAINIDVWNEILHDAAEYVMELTNDLHETTQHSSEDFDIRMLLDRVANCKFFRDLPQYLNNGISELNQSMTSCQVSNDSVSRLIKHHGSAIQSTNKNECIKSDEHLEMATTKSGLCNGGSSDGAQLTDQGQSSLEANTSKNVKKMTGTGNTTKTTIVMNSTGQPYAFAKQSEKPNGSLQNYTLSFCAGLCIGYAVSRIFFPVNQSK